LYTAADPYGSFIETFGQLRTHLISSSELKRKGLARLVARHCLVLVDLAAPGALARLSADSRSLRESMISRSSGRARSTSIRSHGWTACCIQQGMIKRECRSLYSTVPKESS